MSKIARQVGLLTLVLAVMALWFPLAAAAQPDAGKIKIMVLPFEVNAGPDLGYLKDSLPELLADRLEKDGFSVVPQADVSKLIREHNVEYLDLATAKDMALLADANWSVYGSFSQVGETISLDVRLVEAFGVKPAKPLFVVQEGLINAVPAIEDLADKIKLELLRKERIESVDVEGTKVLEKDVVLMRVRAKKGDIYDPKALNDEIKSIYELGYFDDVQVRVDDLPEGMGVTFVVKEKPLIQAVDVLGAEEMDTDDVLELMSTRAGSVLNPKVLADDMGKIKSEYRKEGFYNATVGYELEESDQGQARLHIKIDEGKKLYIEEIRIVGAEQLDEDDLKDELALGERGMFSWITGTGVLKEEYLVRDSAALEAYYGNHGFIEAQVGQPKVEYQEDGIVITFEISEGRRFKIGKVDFEGDLLETPEKLNGIIASDDLHEEEDGYLNRSLLREDAQKLTDYYSDYGYAFAEVDFNIDSHPDTLTADVTFQLHKRQKIYIRRVAIEGNTRTRDNVIRREMRLNDGDLFSGSKLARSTQRLNNLGYFEQADIQTVPTDDPGLMDLKVRVKETTTGEISLGAGWASASGMYLVTKVAEKNLFGKGLYASLEGTFGGSSTAYMASFVNPRFNDSQWLVGSDVYLTKYEWDEYDRNSLGARIRTGRRVGEYSSWGLSYELERYEILEVDEDAAQVIRDVEGTHISSALYSDLVRSTLDRVINPTTGTKSSLAVTYSGGLLMGSDDFIRYVADHSQYVPLWWDHVFHAHGQLGYVMEQFDGDDIPVHRKFYLGGINSVRGYKQRHISPRDDATGDVIGGNKEAFMNLEYIFPLMEETGIVGLFFFDAGEVWDEDDTMDFDFKKSVGAGIRWYSPMGPLRLEYGYALDSVREQGSKGRFEFSIGQFF
ncbi:outer membrane protein assembly factor BamA [Desulfocurvus sp. DL9XJH121]